MNILMASDSNTYTGVELAVYTIMQHNRNVNFYIFTMDIEVDNKALQEIKVYKGLCDWHKSKLKKIVRYFDAHSNIVFIDTLEYYKKYLSGGHNEHSCFTPYATLRLIADKALPNVSHVLYLDCDTAVTGDISAVYNDYVQRDCHYAAWIAEDACDGKGEMVSGVMIMNLDKMRRTGFLDTARRNYLMNHYKYPDQDALRDAGSPVPLPNNFGYCNKLEDCYSLPLVIHFTNEISPKIYLDQPKNRINFFKKFPFLKYADDGIHLLDTINF